MEGDARLIVPHRKATTDPDPKSESNGADILGHILLLIKDIKFSCHAV
jgi:hypothetical protein